MNITRRTLLAATAVLASPFRAFAKPVPLPPEPYGSNFLWGTFGKQGNQPMKIVRLADCSDEHLQAILDTQSHIDNRYFTGIQDIQKYRRENGISVDETFVSDKANELLERASWTFPKKSGTGGQKQNLVRG